MMLGLLQLFVFASRVLTPECPYPRIRLQGDGSAELGVPGEPRTFYEARQVSKALASLEAPLCDVHSAVDPQPHVVEIAADDGVLWGDFVDSVSSVSHITGAQVVVVSDEE